MTAFAAGTSLDGIVQAVPLVVVYLITVGIAGLAIFKLNEGSIVWHKLLAVYTFILGAFITVAIPKVSASLGHLTGAHERLFVVAPMVLLTVVAIIMTILENRGRG